MAGIQNEFRDALIARRVEQTPNRHFRCGHQGGAYMLTRSKLFAGVVCSIALSMCPLLYGQANGSFSGTVADKTGSVIPNATVKITSQATGVTRDAKTDSSGYYLVPLLPVSIYT